MNKELFMSFMEKEFRAMDNRFTYDLVSNVVDFVNENYDGTKRDEVFLKLVPHVTKADLKKYYTEKGEVVEFTVNNMKFYYYKESYRKYPGYVSEKGYVAYGYAEDGVKRAFDFDANGKFCCSWQYGKEPWKNDYFGGVQ